MWGQIIMRERELMGMRRGLLNKLRHQSVIEGDAPSAYLKLTIRLPHSL